MTSRGLIPARAGNTRGGGQPAGVFLRLIPARAGNTMARSPARPPRRAHPRSRGEHDNPKAAAAYRAGSSPLARGTRQEVGILESWKGLIPARAGNTPKTPWWGCRPRAHPRSRGEHACDSSRTQFCAGSSPLARGTLVFSSISQEFQGLIPARAGNTKGQ